MLRKAIVSPKFGQAHLIVAVVFVEEKIMSFGKVVATTVMLCGTALVAGTAFVGIVDRPVKTAAHTKIHIIETPERVEIVNATTRVTVDSAAIEAVWRNWLLEYGVTQSSFAIARDGEILQNSGDARSPDAVYAVASLSKAITGMCLNQLLIESPYTWNSTISDLAPEFAKMNFTPADEVLDLTLAQIATHTSGLPKILEYGNLSTRSTNLSSQPTMARAALKEPANFGARDSFLYSNANYAILGFLIEAMSGESYGDHCTASIMLPAGATDAGVMGRMAKAAGYGGWSVSTEDYARFAMHWFASDQPWMTSLQNYAYDSETGYGMGAYVYPQRGGVSVYHSGRWTHSDPNMPSIGAMLYIATDGTTVVANWNGSLDSDAYSALAQALRNVQ
jgi:CubicO group peptidase (beta-lactamase class C family)